MTSSFLFAQMRATLDVRNGIAPLSKRLLTATMVRRCDWTGGSLRGRMLAHVHLTALEVEESESPN